MDGGCGGKLIYPCKSQIFLPLFVAREESLPPLLLHIHGRGRMVEMGPRAHPRDEELWLPSTMIHAP